MSDQLDRAITVLDPALSGFAGADAWRGIAWEYTDVLQARSEHRAAEAEARRRQEMQALAEREAPIARREFIAKMTALAEHYGRPAPSDELLRSYYKTLDAEMSTAEFVAAADDIFGQDLHWREVIPHMLWHARVHRRGRQ